MRLLAGLRSVVRSLRARVLLQSQRDDVTWLIRLYMPQSRRAHARVAEPRAVGVPEHARRRKVPRSVAFEGAMPAFVALSTRRPAVPADRITVFAVVAASS